MLVSMASRLRSAHREGLPSLLTAACFIQDKPIVISEKQPKDSDVVRCLICTEYLPFCSVKHLSCMQDFDCILSKFAVAEPVRFFAVLEYLVLKRRRRRRLSRSQQKKGFIAPTHLKAAFARSRNQAGPYSLKRKEMLAVFSAM